MKTNDDKVLLVMTNCPDKTVALTIAQNILENNLAACVNVMPEIMSLYTWDGQQEVTTEVPLHIKTTTQAYPDLQALICSLHPYQVPEIIAIPVVDGYLPICNGYKNKQDFNEHASHRNALAAKRFHSRITDAVNERISDSQ